MTTNGLSLMDGCTPAGAGAGTGPRSASEPQTQTCVANIDTAGRRQRLMAGVLQLVIGLGILGWMLATHVDPLWRLPLFLLFAGAATGYFQWSDHTWVGLSGRSSRLIDGKLEKIADPEELAQVQRQARQVLIKSLAAGAVLTLLVLLLPR